MHGIPLIDNYKCLIRISVRLIYSGTGCTKWQVSIVLQIFVGIKTMEFSKSTCWEATGNVSVWPIRLFEQKCMFPLCKMLVFPPIYTGGACTVRKRRMNFWFRRMIICMSKPLYLTTKSNNMQMGTLPFAIRRSRKNLIRRSLICWNHILKPKNEDNVDRFLL